MTHGALALTLHSRAPPPELEISRRWSGGFAPPSTALKASDAGDLASIGGPTIVSVAVAAMFRPTAVHIQGTRASWPSSPKNRYSALMLWCVGK